MWLFRRWWWRHTPPLCRLSNREIAERIFVSENTVKQRCLMQYRELQPDPSLRHVVRCYWFLTGDVVVGAPGKSGEPALPDGSPELIINLADPFQAFGAGAAPVVQPLTMLVGQITRPWRRRRPIPQVRRSSTRSCSMS